MCLSLLALVTSVGLVEDIQVDEIKVTGNALTRLQDPVWGCHVASMSSDGKKIVGYGTPKVNGSHGGFTWSKETGVKALPLPDEFRGVTGHGGASTISDDGLVFGGSGLWMESSSKIASLFERSAVPVKVLIPVPLTDGRIGELNEDGTVAVVYVYGPKGMKLFLWRAATQKVQPLRGRDGQRLLGHVFDMSARGGVLVGCTFRGTDPVGFTLANGKYRQVPGTSKYPFSKVECLTDDGKVAFGNFQDRDNRSSGFRWSVGSTKPLPLPKQFVVQSISGRGEIVAGWAQDEPALLVGERIHLLKEVLRDKLPSETIDNSTIVSVKKVGGSVFLLLDAEHETTDYRITLSASTLGL